jgi:hypothetical protein
LGFSDASGQQFRSVPGLSPEQSRDVAARRDPAFNVTTTESLERGRINAQTINAEANRLNAQANNRFQGIDPETGEFGIFTMGADGQPQATGLSPIVDSIVNGDTGFEIETVDVPGEIPGITVPQTTLFDPRTGATLNLTQQFREELGAAQFLKLRQDNPDADVNDLIRQAEELSGGPLPQLRAAFEQ